MILYIHGSPTAETLHLYVDSLFLRIPNGAGSVTAFSLLTARGILENCYHFRAQLLVFPGKFHLTIYS